MRKRKIRFDRLASVVLIFICLVTLVTFGFIKLTKFILAEQAKNREKYASTIVEINPPVVKLEDQVEEIIVEEQKEDNLVFLGSFKLTGYCNCEECCGQWAGGPCANGEMPEEGWTIAVDPDIIPLNSFVWIDGHRYKAQDTGSAIKGNKIDMYVEAHNDCYADWCNGYHDVYLEIIDN